MMINNIDRYNKNIEKAVNNNSYFEMLKNKSILITGINGLIGSCVVDVLNWLNINKKYKIKIIGIVRNKNNLLDRFKYYKNLIIIEQDVINEILYNEDVDYIIHAASNSHPIAFSNDPVGTMLGNFMGVNNILKFAKNHNCRRVEYISSGEVYGQGEENLKSFDETYSGKINSMEFRSCYPLSKLASETLCISYSEQYGLETVIARPCHCYGPTQTMNDSRVSAQFINNVLNDEDITMKSEGKQVRSYCYVVDCAIAILCILLKGSNINVYNIANNLSTLSIKEMANIIANKASKKVIFKIPENHEKKGYNPVTRSVLNCEKLKKIGWVPCWDFESGIEETIEIMKG